MGFDVSREVELRACANLSAKITAEQCAINRARGISACLHCSGLGARVSASEPARADEVILRFTGDDAALLQRFGILAENGRSLDENVATLIWMILEGQLALRVAG